MMNAAEHDNVFADALNDQMMNAAEHDNVFADGCVHMQVDIIMVGKDHPAIDTYTKDAKLPFSLAAMTAM